MTLRLIFPVLLIGCSGPSDRPADTGTDPQIQDAGAPQQDAGAPQQDAGAPQQDAGAPQQDAGTVANNRTIWAGPRLTFTKPNFADPESPEAQDQITSLVILTRGSGNILYNIVEEVGVNRSVSPAGTLWAMGTTANLDSLNFQPLKQAANSRMQDLPNQDMVLHLVEENIYIDLRFLSWTSGQSSGGGFSYERTTPSP